MLRGLAPIALQARELKLETREIDRLTCEGIFATMTNVNFDAARFTTYIRRSLDYRESLKAQIGGTWSEISNYYSELVEKVPNDCVVLTLACGKFRFFDKVLGNIEGIPRLLDIGQCNDAYSAIQIAIALSQAFEVDVNQLLLSMILSWYEQKAVAILLTLLHLGIQDIRLGSTLPAFIFPNVLKLLSDTYHLKPITTPDADLAACLGQH